MIKKVLSVLFMLLLGSSSLVGQPAKSQWVDSVFTTLDLEGKIGQILMIPIGRYEKSDIDKIESQLKNYRIGGVVFTAGGPGRQVNLTNRLQRQAHIPLLVGMHAEEGLGSVLDSTVQFAPPLMLGAIQDDSLIYFLGTEVGRQLKELGVHINFTPTADLSSSFKKEALLYSSYGDNKDRVAAKVVAYQNGVQSMGVLSVAKHYPDNNSPNASDDFFPLQKLIDNGSAGLVNAHKEDLIFTDIVKRFRSKSFEPGTLSPLYSGEDLKNKLHFNGLVFSYIPDIKPLYKKFKAGDSEVFAFTSGSDVLLFPDNIGATVRKMRKAIKKDAALQKRLDESVKKILLAKFDAGLTKRSEVQSENLLQRLNTSDASILQTALLEESVTIVKDELQVLPIQQLENQSFASLSIGFGKNNDFTKYLDKYSAFTHYQLQIAEDTTNLIKNLQQKDIVIAVIYPYASGIENLYVTLLSKLSERTKVIIVEFVPPAKINLLHHLPVIIEAYTDQEHLQKYIPQLIFGATKATATLPISVNDSIKEGQGIQTASLGRLGYATPEAVGINSMMLERINAIAREAIDKKAAPGCQIVVARRGKIVYEKSAGWQTYDNKIPIDDQTIYDLASVTKVAATLQTTMFLYEKGLLDIYKKASYYLPELLTSNKKDIIIKDILTHQAGLTPFVPFWIQTVKDSDFLPQYYSREKSELYPLQVAPNLYGIKSLRDSLWNWSIKSKLREKPPRTPYTFVYSDVGLYILFHLNEKLLNQPQDEFVQQNLYEPLGATTMGYLPLERFSANRIVPTEIDTLFRKSLLLGTAHDEGAAMLGGVAGHAGLFSNALDLTKLGQMLLQNGYYGGQQYFKPQTVQYFATKQFETSRRGLGWDKPVQSEWNSPTSMLASPMTFGHTGFTGTCIWIDPEFELVYVFLSNRVYPKRSNNKLSTLNIRSRIQDTIYQSIFSYGQYGSSHSAIERHIKATIKNKP